VRKLKLGRPCTGMPPFLSASGASCSGMVKTTWASGAGSRLAACLMSQRSRAED
jgi:hypothetical protein